ncbi:MAG: folate-binding protein [Pseudomonadota bacterium]
MPQTTYLEDRAVIPVSGPDAFSLMQGLVTVDMDRLDDQPCVFGGLLSPQGKIQFDFFIHKEKEGKEELLIDIDGTLAAGFLKRMMLYRLRSKVDIGPISESHFVEVSWGADVSGASPDPRLEAMGQRQIVQEKLEANATPDDYHAHRTALGIPEAGKDFALNDIFPHDAMMDSLHGVDFAKGCYVGQEVVSRMKHRGTARKRFFIASGAEQFPEAGEALTRDGKSIGTLGAHFGGRALALVRTDRLGDELTVDGSTGTMTLEPVTYTRSEPA